MTDRIITLACSFGIEGDKLEVRKTDLAGKRAIHLRIEQTRSIENDEDRDTDRASAIAFLDEDATRQLFNALGIWLHKS